MKKEKEKEKDSLDLKKIKAEADKNDFIFLKGKLNFDSPLNIVLRNNLKVSMEELICRKDIKVQELKKECSIIILKKKIYFTEVIGSVPTDVDSKEKKEPYIRKIEYPFIHEIEIDEKGTPTLILNLVNQASPSNNEKLTLSFNNIDDAIICKHFIEKEMKLYWQKFFEINIPLNEPDCYQAHFFITKINRKKNEDARVFVVTDRFIFNIAYTYVQSKTPDSIDLIKIKDIKWAIAIEFFKYLLVNQNELKKKNYVLTIEMDKDKGAEYVQKAKYPHKKKKDCEFMFDNERNMDLFIFHVKRLYYKLNKSYIPTSKDKK